VPFADYEDFDACVAANSDKDDPEAYCGAIKDQVEASEFEGERIHDTAEKYHVRPETAVNILAEAELHLDEDDPCWDGYTMVGTPRRRRAGREPVDPARHGVGVAT